MTNLLFWQLQELSQAHQIQVQTPVLTQVQVILVTLTARNSGFDLNEFVKDDVILNNNIRVMMTSLLSIKIDFSAASDFPEEAAAMPSEFSNSEVSDAVRMY